MASGQAEKTSSGKLRYDPECLFRFERASFFRSVHTQSEIGTLPEQPDNSPMLFSPQDGVIYYR